jgi:hypothetical protein
MSSLGEWEWTKEGEENYVGASVVWSSFLSIIRSTPGHLQDVGHRPYQFIWGIH